MGFLDKAKEQGKVPAKAGAAGGKGATGKAADRAPSKRAGRYAGLPSQAPRAQRLRDGRYQLLVLQGTGDFDGRNHDFYRVKVRVLAAAEGAACKVGDEAIHDYMVDKGDMLDMNGPKVVTFVMTALGFETEEAFRAEYPANSQEAIDLMTAAADAELGEGDNPVVGMKIMAEAYGNGRQADDGSEYQNVNWAVNEE